MKTLGASLVVLICSAVLMLTSEGQVQRPQLRCQCIQTHSKPVIPSRKILALKIIPEGPQCRHQQIIATLKKGKICLNPAENWVISLKEKFAGLTGATTAAETTTLV
ncbi:hypothetical protein DNTS_012026 [Danionella cerebrum]|uniref:Chemokine interleukin-8-like domain-containing protein n=1 Tax=Danionella cerebrum TaxID=2873325 RepID=A0A553MX25_9TELE|nr:hypothetical protein DNTS_012026 [Danionella translucida]TRY57752.1 hypothetical protein DNTS_012026 [Danionella translucida]